MIVRPRLRWSMVARAVGRQTGAVAALSVAVSILVVRYGQTWMALSGLPLAVLASALGIFLGFRNNSAYDRWWEARGLWGGIVNQSRTLVRQAIAFGGDEFGGEVARLVSAFAYATRDFLRGQDPAPEIERLVPETPGLQDCRSVPNAILTELARRIARSHVEGGPGEVQQTTMEETLGRLTDMLGGCERIKNTPMLRQYDTIPRVLVYTLAVLLPFALVKDLGWFTVVGATLTAFLFFCLETIGRIVEAPFENGPNDIPMTALSVVIEIDARQMSGLGDEPEPVRPVDGVLM